MRLPSSYYVARCDGMESNEYRVSILGLLDRKKFAHPSYILIYPGYHFINAEKEKTVLLER
jgi:hypothetical protein